MVDFEVAISLELKIPKMQFLKEQKKGKIHPPKQGSKKGPKLQKSG
jgi:hypothetical protein